MDGAKSQQGIGAAARMTERDSPLRVQSFISELKGALLRVDALLGLRPCRSLPEFAFAISGQQAASNSILGSDRGNFLTDARKNGILYC